MKIAKATNRFCPKCGKHTNHKITQVKGKTRSTAHPLSRGGKVRMRARGLRRGAGNQNKYSRPTKPKRSGSKASKKTNFKYTCNECKKSTIQKKGIRAKKVEIK